MDEELELLFDPDPFIASIEKMKASFDSFAESMQKKDKTTQSSIVKENKKSSNEIFNAFKKIALIGGFFIGIYRGVKGLVQRIPEIGMAFKIAGDIFYRNFLWPLRRMLIPMLNNFLRWVRDSRIMFIQWGQVLVNIFVIVKIAISTAVKLIKNLIDGFLEGINKGTGRMFKNLTELINLTLFKIAMILAMINVKLEPIMKLLGDIFGQVTESVIKFTKGFIKGFIGVAEKIDILGKLEKILGGVLEIVKELEPLLEPLGTALGALVAGTLGVALDIIDGVISGINTIIDLLSGNITGEEMGRKAEAWFNKHKMIKALVIPGGWQELLDERNKKKKEEKVKDAIITKEGKILRTDPMDTLIATKNPNRFGMNEINLKFDNIFNITVSEGNAKNAGENFGMGLMNMINFELKKEYKLQGN